MSRRPDKIDKMVFSETHAIRKEYQEARERLHLPPKELSPIVIMQRSVTP